jgi:uncharacterized membrane-anchored protein
MKKFLKLASLSSLASCLFCFSLSVSAAEPAAKAEPKAEQKAAASKPAKPKKPSKQQSELVPDEDNVKADITASKVFDYKCEQGNVLTVFVNADDDKFIGLRWKKSIHRLRRVDTDTGANRFENKKAGLLWIGIPSKGILLDTRKGQQLANECKTAEMQ